MGAFVCGQAMQSEVDADMASTHMSEVCGGVQASALAFTIYTLAKHPDKTEKLVKVRLWRLHFIKPHPARPAYLQCCRPACRSMLGHV